MSQSTNAAHKRHELNRREYLLTTTFATAALSAGLPAAQTAQAQAADLSQARNRFPRMVQEYYVRQLREFEKRNLLEKSTIHNQEDAEAYIEDMRNRIQECFGPFPEKTPLNPRVTKVTERDDYTIENVIFESRPNFLVTANLYVPKNRMLPLPGVIATCGHSTNGKAASLYQAFAQGLARMGYVVLIFDPLGQGERLQYVDDQLNSRVGVGVREHLMAGNQQFLVGEFIGTWRAWDGIRALDYLLTRDEVDPDHIGLTGNSGGGTMTTWLCGLDDRYTMAAPSCFVTTFRRNLENELPADTEQCPPKALALGVDHCDFLLCMAPKPVIILAKEKDFFDVRGSIEAHQRLQPIYQQLKAKDNIGLFIGPTGHGFSQENREAMYQWFNQTTHISLQTTEPDITIEEDETLWCTPNGQVAELGSRPVFSFTQEKAQQLRNNIIFRSNTPPPSGQALKQIITQLLKLPRLPEKPSYRILRPHASDGYPKRWASTYVINTEPGMHAIVYRLAEERLLSRPPQTQQPALLYVAHHSSDAELQSESTIRDALSNHPDAALYSCDVRGIGESRPATAGTHWLHAYGSDFMYAIHAIMLDSPYVGGKTHDLLTVLNWLKQFGHQEIHILANGWGTIPATLAAVLSDHVATIALKDAPKSYLEIAQTEIYDWPLSSFIPNVLAHFDLPDCYSELQSKQIRFL